MYEKYHRDNTYNKLNSTFTNIFLKRFLLIKKHCHFSYPAKVLDIGCSNGLFLDIFKRDSWETWGVDPSLNSFEALKKKHKVIRSAFEAVKLPENYFDLVIMNHTLEHMKNPQEVLKKIHALLKEGGIVFIDVPNVGSLLSKIMGKYWPYLLPKEHLWQFDRKKITNLLKGAGFKVLYWESRSGIFEYAWPLLELKRKRFLIDIIISPFSLIATFLNMGDSMSIIARKK